MILYLIALGVILFGVIFHLFTKKYLNPYKMIMIFGKKGCGKTTYLTKIAFQHIKKGWTVYATEPIPGTYLIDPKQIGFYEFPENSVILVDEVGMVWDNRNFKSFPPEVRNWAKYLRHSRCKAYLFSQTFDIDKKLRDVTDSMYLLKNVARVWSYGKRINKHFVLNDSTPEAPSNIAENLSFDSPLLFFLGSRTLTFIPKYAKYFNSHVKLSGLDPIQAEITPYPEGVKECTKKSLLSRFH